MERRDWNGSSVRDPLRGPGSWSWTPGSPSCCLWSRTHPHVSAAALQLLLLLHVLLLPVGCIDLLLTFLRSIFLSFPRMCPERPAGRMRQAIASSACSLPSIPPGGAHLLLLLKLQVELKPSASNAERLHGRLWMTWERDDGPEICYFPS